MEGWRDRDGGIEREVDTEIERGREKACTKMHTLSNTASGG